MPKKALLDAAKRLKKLLKLTGEHVPSNISKRQIEGKYRDRVESIIKFLSDFSEVALLYLINGNPKVFNLLLSYSQCHKLPKAILASLHKCKHSQHLKHDSGTKDLEEDDDADDEKEADTDHDYDSDDGDDYDSDEDDDATGGDAKRDHDKEEDASGDYFDNEDADGYYDYSDDDDATGGDVEREREDFDSQEGHEAVSADKEQDEEFEELVSIIEPTNYTTTQIGHYPGNQTIEDWQQQYEIGWTYIPGGEPITFPIVIGEVLLQM